MSAASPALGLCRCGRTTTLNDPNTRKALVCGHYICNDCWTFGQPVPADPWCGECIIALYHNDLLRRVKRHEQFEVAYNQKLKQAADTIGKLKTIMSLNMQKNRNTPQVDSPTTALHLLPNAQDVPSSSAGPSGMAAAIDWNSDQAKTFQGYLREGGKLLTASQNENAELKSRVAKLTAQLEAKSPPDGETLTAVEKAELMEAELEGLHERLDTCEEELQKAQSELAKAMAGKEEMTREIERYKAVAMSTEETMRKAYNQFTGLQNAYAQKEKELAEVKQSLEAKEKVFQSFIEARSSEERAAKTASSAEREKTVITLKSLQAIIAKLNGEKADAEQTIRRLTEAVNEKELENNTLEGRLAKSTELASELGRLHLAANKRSEAAESKLLSAQKELQELKLPQQKENEDMHNFVDAASGLAQQSEYKSHIATLEAKLAEATRIRENAVTQAKSWERNRDAWKRWGEVMELRAKQAKEEALKARMALSGEADSGTGLQEPPPVTPFAMTPEPTFPEELGKTRKRPLDVPDTDVDGLHAIAQTSSDPAHAAGAESESGRKKARLTPAS